MVCPKSYAPPASSSKGRPKVCPIHAPAVVCPMVLTGAVWPNDHHVLACQEGLHLGAPKICAPRALLAGGSMA